MCSIELVDVSHWLRHDISKKPKSSAADERNEQSNQRRRKNSLVSIINWSSTGLWACGTCGSRADEQIFGWGENMGKPQTS